MKVLVSILVALLVAVGCGGTAAAPSAVPSPRDSPTAAVQPASALVAEELTPAGSRQLVITVHNMTKARVQLFVAENGSPMGQEVGTADPSTIGSRMGREVVFTVPPGDRWAIFVDPDPDDDGLISARHVPPNASGAIPFTIWVDEGVEPLVVGPGGERWPGG